MREDASANKLLELVHKNYHTMADEKPWEAALELGYNVDEMIQNSKLAIYVQFEDRKKTDNRHNLLRLRDYMLQVTEEWAGSTDQVALYRGLAAME